MPADTSANRLQLLPCLVLAGLAIFALSAADGPAPSGFQPFSFLSDSGIWGLPEKVALFFALFVSLAAILYAFVLGKKVFAAEQGTTAMRAICQAVRDGSDAYLRRQFTTVGILLVFLTACLILAKWPWAGGPDAEEAKFIAVSRGVAFFFGAVFSGAVGFFGMRLATTGNLRVAAAARKGFPEAMKLGYQTGIVTGMLTTGMGLLGGCLLVLIVGEKAYLTLLGFAFGGSLLALFMRVGGGIYTKAADVGADLVGKYENSIPEDDPRNAATIADNVGDNVGDCAGMAADVFESYTVTMVAAMILGYAAFGPKALLLPLLFQAVGILASMISTSLVGRLPSEPTATGAMHTINTSFRIGAVLSVIGIFVAGALFLRFDSSYIIGQSLEKGLAKKTPQFWEANGLDSSKDGGELLHLWRGKSVEDREKIAAGTLPTGETVLDAARKIVPLPVDGPDLRPMMACLLGVILTLLLMKCTEYWTSTDYTPVRSIVESSKTGAATNIIQGIAVGYESTVWSSVMIAAALFVGVSIYADTGNPVCVAYGVALAGIGMLALTGDTLAMDVFGPVSDNASGIGEMGFNRDTQFRELAVGDPEYMPEAENKVARRILSDLDATGNTTKAITKGIAIGSAVLAAVSLFASFIAVLVKGSEESINQLTPDDFLSKAGNLSIASPEVFIGMLIGGAVPFLFSSMTIRAVGRAAGLIVQECREQFKDPGIMAGTKRPDYGRVVGICTSMAQKELIGPGILAIGTPILVGFLMGPYALGGFLAGMIVVGQLIAVFMATAGGAWDNCKKMVEDEERTATSGKGSEKHKASVTGDTVGDPLKDTAGPAINPLIKVMNMVSLLVLPLVLVHNVASGTGEHQTGWIAIIIASSGIIWAWWESKKG